MAEMQTPLLIKRARGDCGVSQMCRALEVQKGKMGSSAGGRVGHAKHVIYTPLLPLDSGSGRDAKPRRVGRHERVTSLNPEDASSQVTA